MQKSLLILIPLFLSIPTFGLPNPGSKYYGEIQSKKVTLSAIDMPLKDVFQTINKQTGYSITNNEEETRLSETRKVTVNFVQTDINVVMNSLLGDKDDLGYIIHAESIVIIRRIKDGTNIKIKNDTSRQNPITGKVVDSLGQPIPGATIKVKNGKYGTITNVDGSFRLPHIIKGDIIVVSSIGFENNEVEIKSDNTLVQLKPYTSKLDEKVIIAYGHTTKRFNTGNVGSIKAIDIEKQPVNNPLLALEGRVAGVFIEQSSGFSGTGITINIQGRNSFFSGNDPFFVIDGVPYISQLLQPVQPGITAGFSGITGNPLNFINPSDVESIEILKDADATAIYGSRAANGAVLITTKKGKNGSMQVDLNIQNGWGKVGKKMKILNAEEYLEMRHEALKNDGITNPGINDYDLNGQWDTTQTKNWQKELIGGTAQYKDIQLSISGGASLTQYLISGGYHKETTVFPGDFSDVKGSVHFSLRSGSTNQKFKIQLSGSYMKDQNRLPTTDLTGKALQLSPVAPMPLNPDGSLNWAPSATGATTYFNNPLAFIKKKYTNKTNNLTSQASLSYDIYPWITIKTNIGYNSLNSNETSILPLSAVIPEALRFAKRTTSIGTTSMNSWLVEPGLEINQAISGGKLNAYLGATIQQNDNNRQDISASGFNNDLVMEDIKSATELLATQSIFSTYKYSAIYGRINYNWLDKYIINFTARRDGSSRFGSRNQFHNFGAIGAAWVFSGEKFIQNSVPILSFGKLRGSYGITGNDQIPDYQFLDLYDAIPAQVPYQMSALGLAPNRLTSPDLEWEATRKLQFGIELGFAKDRYILNINYNKNRSSNQLIGLPLPIITGFTNIIGNFDAVIQNTGWEVTASSTNIKAKNFNWTSTFNLTIPKNKLVSYDQNSNVLFTKGQSISALPVFELAGVNDSTGLLQFKDEKGNKTNNPPATTTSYILTDPVFYGGIQNSLTYKAFSIDVFIQFVKRTGADVSLGYGSQPGMLNNGLSNQPITVLDRWQKFGDKTSQPKYSTSYDSYLTLLTARGSDASYSDASFLRLKNVSFSWIMPEKWAKKIKIERLRLYLQGQNLFTITNYFGLDPESRGIGLPPLRVITFGVQITL